MFDLANGCNSCETFGSNVNSNMNSNMNNNTNTNMAQGNPMNMNNQTTMNMNNQNMMMSTNQLQPSTQAQPMMNNNAQQETNNINNNQLAEDIRNAVTKGVMNRVQKNLNNNAKAVKKVENKVLDNLTGENNVDDKKEETKKLVMFGLVVLAALSWNEASRFMLEQHLKFSEGNNTSYYLAYAVVVTLAVVFVKKMLD
jgi:hypothetical protein